MRLSDLLLMATATCFAISDGEPSGNHIDHPKTVNFTNVTGIKDSPNRLRKTHHTLEEIQTEERAGPFSEEAAQKLVATAIIDSAIGKARAKHQGDTLKRIEKLLQDEELFNAFEASFEKGVTPEDYRKDSDFPSHSEQSLTVAESLAYGFYYAAKQEAKNRSNA